MGITMEVTLAQGGVMRTPGSWHRLAQYTALILGVACIATPCVRAQNQIRGHVSVASHDANSIRVIDATFTVDHDAYVVVGHEGADGRIRIMYPASPTDSGFVRAGERVQTPGLEVSEDVPINGYTRQISMRRNIPAVTASYDGIGVGYVFLIASAEPMHRQNIVDGDDWAWLSGHDYFTTDDPRLAIRDLADQLGLPQTGPMDEPTELLTFADEYGTVASGVPASGGFGYSSQNAYGSLDCIQAGYTAFPAAFYGLGLLPLQGGYGLSAYRYNALSPSYLYNDGLGCNGGYYGYSRYAFGVVRWIWRLWGVWRRVSTGDRASRSTRHRIRTANLLPVHSFRRPGILKRPGAGGPGNAADNSAYFACGRAASSGDGPGAQRKPTPPRQPTPRPRSTTAYGRAARNTAAACGCPTPRGGTSGGRAGEVGQLIALASARKTARVA